MNQLTDTGKKKPSLLQKYNIPIPHLSYEYVEKCNDVKELERIVRILRSGEEGDYPKLTESAEKRLSQLAPQSRVLRKEEPLLTKSLLPTQHWQQLSNEMEEWTEEMKSREEALEQVADKSRHLPGVRKTSTATKSDKPKCKSVVPRDYADWEKFDADKEILRMEVEDERRKEHADKLKKKKKKKDIQQEAKQMLTAAEEVSAPERTLLAVQEKDKGNEYYKVGSYEEAVEHYSRSIALDPTPVAYNNRAMAYLKLNNFAAVVADCNKVLSCEPRNVKALMRRGLAYKHTQDFAKALEDFQQAVQLEPENKHSKSLLHEMQHKCNTKLNTVRMAIEDESKYTLSSPCKNMRLNEWGLATRMCNCSGVPSWVRRPPPKCNTCAKKKAECSRDPGARGDVEHRDKKLVRRRVTSDTEVKDPIKQMRVQVADKYKKTVRKPGEEEMPAESNSDLHDINSPFEFLKEWQSIKLDSELFAHARVLRAVKPAHLNAVIGNKLDGPMLSLILACLDRHFVVTDAQLALEYLRHLSELPRFNIISMFLQPLDKQVVWSLFEKLESQGQHPPAALKKAFVSTT